MEELNTRPNKNIELQGATNGRYLSSQIAIKPIIPSPLTSPTQLQRSPSQPMCLPSIKPATPHTLPILSVSSQSRPDSIRHSKKISGLIQNISIICCKYFHSVINPHIHSFPPPLPSHHLLLNNPESIIPTTKGISYADSAHTDSGHESKSWPAMPRYEFKERALLYPLFNSIPRHITLSQRTNSLTKTLHKSPAESTRHMKTTSFSTHLTNLEPHVTRHEKYNIGYHELRGRFTSTVITPPRSAHTIYFHLRNQKGKLKNLEFIDLYF